eukprot:6853571-Alexandrium_andersonii.AAC.1
MAAAAMAQDMFEGRPSGPGGSGDLWPPGPGGGGSSSRWSAAPGDRRLSGPTDELAALVGDAVGEFIEPAGEMGDVQRSSFHVLCQAKDNR